MKIENLKKQVPYYFFEDIFDQNILENYSLKYPPDYLNFIREYGEGIIGEYIRIYPPHIAEKIEKKWKNESGKHIQKTYFNQVPFLENAIFIGDTLDGDQIFFFDNYYYAYSVEGPAGFLEKTGSKLTSILSFYNSGKYWEPIDVESFTPFNSKWFPSVDKKIV